MPGQDSDDGGDYQQVAEGEKQQGSEGQVSRQSSKEQLGKGKEKDSDRGTVSDRDDEPPPQARGAGAYDGGGGGGGDGDRVPWAKPLQILCLVTLGLSLLLMIIITASRSWGIGKYPNSMEISAGLFTVCTEMMGDERCVGYAEGCPDAKDQIGAAAAFSIMSILLLVLMVALQVLEFIKKENTPKFFDKVQTVLHHVLWFFLLLCWALWAGKHNASECWDVLWYAWGWFFVLWMWLVHMFVAILLTMKVFCGKPLPCGLSPPESA